jgi:PAS domain S-box-containing protein
MKQIGHWNPLSVGGWALIGVCLALIRFDTVRGGQLRQTALADACVRMWELARSLAEQAPGAVLAFAGLVAGLGLLMLRGGRRRQAAEREAASAAAEYRLLVDHASDLTLRVRAGGQRVFASPACLPLLGYTPEELLQLRSGDDTHPEDLRRLEPKWAMAFGTDGVATCRYRMRRRDGRYIWVEEASRSLPRRPGEPPENLVVVRDITERHRDSERLQEANRLLLRAEAITHLGHWRYDLDSRSLFWSDEMYRIVGWPGDRAPTAETATEVYHPDDRAEAAARLRATIETGEPSASRLRVLRPDASVRHVLTHGEAEYADDGCLVALVGTMQDVTENHELETRLRHSRKLEAIGHLASGVAHDFNNILQGVLGGLELIQEDRRFEPELRCFADVALKSAQRGASLTHQLLSFARKQMLMPRPVAVAPIVADLRAILSRGIGPHIVIEQTVAASLPEIFVDPEHLQTALFNMAINAVHAMADGGRLSIEASLEPGRARAEPRVVITITDTGCGMDAATLAQATEPFFTTKGPAGTGLGLPMVQGFARQSGGDLRLSSLPGLGTRVEIALPQHIPMQQGIDAASAGPARPGGHHILLVDDVPEALFATASFLKKSGLEVATAESGAAALALLAAGARFAALVTDYAMPHMNGLDLVTLARNIQPGLPALVITGFAEIDFSRATHVAAVLRKPFRRKELLDAIAGLLETPLDANTIPAEDFAGVAPRP